MTDKQVKSESDLKENNLINFNNFSVWETVINAAGGPRLQSWLNQSNNKSPFLYLNINWDTV